MILSTTSKCFLNTSRDSDSTTSLGSPFQCLTILLENRFFQISNLNLPWGNTRTVPLVLVLTVSVILSKKISSLALFYTDQHMSVSHK